MCTRVTENRKRNRTVAIKKVHIYVFFLIYECNKRKQNCMFQYHCTIMYFVFHYFTRQLKDCHNLINCFKLWNNLSLTFPCLQRFLFFTDQIFNSLTIPSPWKNIQFHCFFKSAGNPVEGIIWIWLWHNTNLFKQYKSYCQLNHHVQG